jgi:hypothetical protein
LPAAPILPHRAGRPVRSPPDSGEEAGPRLEEAVSPSSAVRQPNRRVLAVAGLASTANGVALVAHITGRISLPLLLATAWVIGAIAVAAVVRLSAPGTSRALGRRIAVGASAAVVATVVYDVTKAILSTADPSPYNPFEAVRIFGEILIGTGQQDALTRAVGWVFHGANGITFGVAYSLLFAPSSTRLRAALTGIAWGVFLETFQLTLYPGWLNVKFLAEFQTISFLSHIAFGATLGVLCRALILRPRQSA